MDNEYLVKQSDYIALERENKELKEEIQGLKNLYENMASAFKNECIKNNRAIEYLEYNNECLYTFEPDYDYEENIIDKYEPSNYREDLLEILKEEENESPYCEICGTCGCIDCCGIRNFIEYHIEGKTNCKNEGWIITDLINLCEYKDKVFEDNKQLKDNWNKLKEILPNVSKQYKNQFQLFSANCCEHILEIMQELENGDINED